MTPHEEVAELSTSYQINAGADCGRDEDFVYAEIREGDTHLQLAGPISWAMPILRAAHGLIDLSDNATCDEYEDHVASMVEYIRYGAGQLANDALDDLNALDVDIVCPVCGKVIELLELTVYGQVIGSCGDAFRADRLSNKECERCGTQSFYPVCIDCSITENL